jgi:hypothetical protein
MNRAGALLTIVWVLALAAPAAIAVSHPARPLRQHTMIASKDQPARWRTTVPSTVVYTPCFYINGQPLLIGELSNDAMTATFYGSGSVGQTDQRGSTVFIDVATVRSRERVTIDLFPGTVDC